MCMNPAQEWFSKLLSESICIQVTCLSCFEQVPDWQQAIVAIADLLSVLYSSGFAVRLVLFKIQIQVTGSRCFKPNIQSMRTNCGNCSSLEEMCLYLSYAKKKLKPTVRTTKTLNDRSTIFFTNYRQWQLLSGRRSLAKRSCICPVPKLLHSCMESSCTRNHELTRLTFFAGKWWCQANHCDLHNGEY
jgi:hypothetical protein